MKMEERNMVFPPGHEIPIYDRGKFYAYFYTTRSDRDEKIKQYNPNDEISYKQKLIKEITEDEIELERLQTQAVLWNLQDDPDIEVIKKFKRKTPPFRHSDDYRIVYLWGEEYELTYLQSIAIRTLHVAYKNNIFKLSFKDILHKYPVNQVPDRLSDVFKGNQRAWKELITYKKNGIYSLKNL